MYVRNIREIKQNLRAQYRQYRERLDPERKLGLDSSIQSRLLALSEYAKADIIFTYVSKPIEVDTTSLIRAALANRKRVAVPRCLMKTYQMEFYEIGSLDGLECGSFGVLEPVPSMDRLVTDFSGGLCIVPGLSFDAQGYRLGYGKGFYDRFLANFGGVAVGLCYSKCVQWNLPHGYYDRSVDILITEKYIRRIVRQK